MKKFRCKGDYFIQDNIKRGMVLLRKKVILPDGEIAVLGTGQRGRKLVGLRARNKKTTVHYARILCWFYFGPPPNDGRLYDAEHRNRDPKDDSKRNLRWATRSVNVKNTKPYYRGPYPKLTKEQAEDIRQQIQNGKYYRTLAAEFGVGLGTICRIAKNDWCPIYHKRSYPLVPASM